MTHNLELPKERREYFDYYEKTLVEEKIDELIRDKILLEEKLEETNDFIVDDRDILENNNCIYFFAEKYDRFRPKYFYNLTLAEKIYGKDFIVEILYYSIQRVLRNIVDHIEDAQKKSKAPELHIDIKVLKKINYSEANKKIIDFFKALDDEDDNSENDEKESYHVLDIKEENGLGYDDNDSSLVDFDCEEKLQNIVEAILTEWFIRIFYYDYKPVFYKYD
jgi:hypothetical protein